MHRRDIWGDDPEERDAEDVVAELSEEAGATADARQQRRMFLPFKAVASFVGRNAKRVAVTVVGLVVVLVGLLMLVLPGPGILTIIAGLAILATEYVWAERLLVTAKRRAAEAKDAAVSRMRKRPGR